ncbi:MAG: hypothetical protein VKL00_11005 [Synechococcales bacterium]|nr:hypothetical protein [Cyanobacteria bacterium REEB444]MEB3126134.1 hypothetical protein [Synechococcales bacterium]
MAIPEKQDWASKLKDFEAKINQLGLDPTNSQPLTEQGKSNEWITGWFARLPPVAKWIAGGLGVMLLLALLRAAINLIALVVSVAVFAGLIYVVYKLFFSSSDS